MGEALEAIARELLDVVGRHDRADDDGTAEVVVREVVGVGEVAEEAAREGVAGAGRVGDVLERVAGGDEDMAVLLDQERAVLALLDDDGLGTELEDALGGGQEVGGLAELTGFALVEEDDVDPLEDFDQLGALAGDPEVHGVADGELGTLHLVEHEELKLGVDVAQEEELRVSVVLGKGGLEVGEDVQVGEQGVRLVHVLLVVALPAEGEAIGPLEAFDVDLAVAEKLDMLFREVGTDDADHVDRAEEAGGHGGVGGRAAERVVDFAKGRAHRVECDGPYDREFAHHSPR